MGSGTIIYVLVEDGDGTTFSTPKPTGFAVKEEGKAKEWVEKGNLGYCREYVKVTIVDEA